MSSISILINTYNDNQRFLKEAVNSCLNQKNVNVQLIVSTVKGDPSIRTLKNINISDVVINDEPGLVSQINNGVKKASCEWFFYFSGNDVALPHKAIDEINACKEQGKLIGYSPFFHTREDLSIKHTAKFHPYSLSKHLDGNFVSDVSIVHKTILDKYLPFDESLKNAAYWDFWIRIAKDNKNIFAYNNKPEWYYRVCSDSSHIIRKQNMIKKIQNLEQKRDFYKKHRELLRKFNKLNKINNLTKQIDTLKGS